MPYLDWLPTAAGGVDLYEDPSSIAPNRLIRCDNYYPVGARWKLIEGNTAHSTSATAERIQNLVEYQVDNTSGGTTKTLLAFTFTGADNRIYQISGGGWGSQLTGTALGATTAPVWDFTVFQGDLVMAGGPLFEVLKTSNGTGYSVLGGPTPSTPRYCEAWKNRLFIAGRNAAPLSVHYCADGDFTTWTGSDSGTEVITSPVGDYVTGIRSVENYLAVFTNRTITVLIGDHPDDWTKRTLYEDHGCVSHRTVQKMNGGLLYANQSGVWLLTSELKRIELSKAIRPYWQGDTTNALGVARNKNRGANMHAVYDPGPLNRYYIWTAEGSASTENVCWILHLNNGEWSRMVSTVDAGQTVQASCLRENTSGNLQVYFSGGMDDVTTADKRIYTIGTGASFDSRTGGNIAGRLTSGALGSTFNPRADLLGIASTKLWTDMLAKFLATTTASQQVSFTFSGYSSDAKVAQRTITVPITSASADVIRPRIPIAVRGWGMQADMTYTGQVTHAFLGGLISYTDKGEM